MTLEKRTMTTVLYLPWIEPRFIIFSRRKPRIAYVTFVAALLYGDLAAEQMVSSVAVYRPHNVAEQARANTIDAYRAANIAPQHRGKNVDSYRPSNMAFQPRDKFVDTYRPANLAVIETVVVF